MKLDERFQAYHGELVCPDSSQVHDTLTGDVVADFPSPREPRDGPQARRQAARADHLAATLNRTPRLRVGMTVRVSGWVDRYPHFLIPEGATGVVTELDVNDAGWFSIWIHMDEDMGEDCAEWHNEVNIWSDMFAPEDGITVEQAFGMEFEATGYARYTIDHGSDRYDLAGFLEQDLSYDEAMDLRALRVGESCVLGGGAAAEFVITRVE